jgi:NADH-quinone oxidoreductase subunit H
MRFLSDPLGVVRDGLDALLSAILPAWLSNAILELLGVVLVVALVPGLVVTAVYLERRIIAKMQDRIGPNRVGPFGLLQPIADVLKLLSKEDIIPARADVPLFILAPILVVGASLMVWATIPWAPGLAPTDLNVGVLFIVAMGALPAIGIVMAGWASYNKYSLLGAMRSVAQLISYEIPGILGALVPVMLAGSMSLQAIVQAQANLWYIFYFPIGPLAFLLFVISGVAESNRTPFDLIEAESELAAGFHTEYSGMRFALFFLAEYANMFAISAVATILFLGGWSFPLDFLPIPPFVWFIAKMYVMLFVFIWLRATLPRLRYDQLMHFAWKRLLPLGLLNVGVTGVVLSVARGFVR